MEGTRASYKNTSTIFLKIMLDGYLVFTGFSRKHQCFQKKNR